MNLLERLRSMRIVSPEVPPMSYRVQLDNLINSRFISEGLREALLTLQRDIDNACALERREPTIAEHNVRIEITHYLQQIEEKLPRAVTPREARILNAVPKKPFI